MRTYFARIIVAALRICSQCGDEIEEGSLAYRAKNTDIWCCVCKDYEDQRE
jgi:hypothetical protein